MSAGDQEIPEERRVWERQHLNCRGTEGEGRRKTEGKKLRGRGEKQHQWEVEIERAPLKGQHKTNETYSWIPQDTRGSGRESRRWMVRCRSGGVKVLSCRLSRTRGSSILLSLDFGFRETGGNEGIPARHVTGALEGRTPGGGEVL